MTIDEIFDKELNCELDICRCSDSECDICHNAFRSGFDMAKKEKAKYDWHDLRKNPNDLPDDKKQHDFIVCYETEPNHMLGYVHANYILNEWCVPDECIDDTVIGWKYIEPFENVN